MSLELRDVAVDAGGRRIVSGIGFTVPDGSFAGLLGPNGSGKSTILKAIYRVNRPTAGRVLLDGADLLAMRPRAAAQRVAVVAQEFTLEFDFTVAELVMIGRTPHKRAFERDDAADRAVAGQALAQVGCEDLAHRSFGSLSGGEKQRVLIAQAIAQGADHLILDEPPALATAAAGLAAAASLLAGCGEAAVTPAAAPSRAAAHPVTITNCGSTVTYDRAPRRAVSNDINTTEDMLALGLESRMAGTFGVTGDGPAGQPVPAPYLAGFHQVRAVSPGYFTKETLVGLHPDFLFAGWNYGLETGTSLTPQGLAAFGIKTLALTESCAHVPPGTTAVSITDTYEDLRNLGEIFSVRARAATVIAGMQAQVAAARAKISGLPPVTVFDYDSGEAAPFTGPGLAMPTALISLGGGSNIFGSLKQSWTSVSWEQVVQADPTCIIINDYGTPTAAQKEKFLETSPVTRNLTAVRHRCFLPLAYDEVTPGPRNAQAAVVIARWLHPAAFGLPAGGS